MEPECCFLPRFSCSIVDRRHRNFLFYVEIPPKQAQSAGLRHRMASHGMARHAVQWVSMHHKLQCKCNALRHDAMNFKLQCKCCESRERMCAAIPACDPPSASIHKQMYCLHIVMCFSIYCVTILERKMCFVSQANSIEIQKSIPGGW